MREWTESHIVASGVVNRKTKDFKHQEDIRGMNCVRFFRLRVGSGDRTCQPGETWDFGLRAGRGQLGLPSESVLQDPISPLFELREGDGPRTHQPLVVQVIHHFLQAKPQLQAFHPEGSGFDHLNRSFLRCQLPEEPVQTFHRHPALDFRVSLQSPDDPNSMAFLF